MIRDLKRYYRELKASPPGKRFQELHKRRGNRSKSRKPLFIVGGVILIAVGIVLLILPGPGAILIVAGAGLFAQELLVVARALDSMELRLRKLLGKEKRDN